MDYGGRCDVVEVELRDASAIIVRQLRQFFGELSYLLNVPTPPGVHDGDQLIIFQPSTRIPFML